MNNNTRRCPLCHRVVSKCELEEITWQTPGTIAQLAHVHPDWRIADGACPACVQEALLHVLLSQGDAALHRQLQRAWPLDAEAAFGAIPTPLRLHADPRFTGKGVTVAIVDAGFYPHPDLIEPTNRILGWVDVTREPVVVQRFHTDQTPTWPEWDTRHDRQWHGTMTSAVLAGNGTRSHGLYRGLASDADLVLIQVRNDAGHITDTNIVRALQWLAEHAAEFGIRVVNLSLGGDAPPHVDNPIDVAVDRLVAGGVIVVAAAGNDGSRRLTPPASAPTALTVGGIDDQNTFDHAAMVLWHSNYGNTGAGVNKPELVAPSIWVVAPILPGTTVEEEAKALFAQRQANLKNSPDGAKIEARIASTKLITPYYQHVDGTSFAAPLVASAVVCMLEANPELSPDLVRQLLLATAQAVPSVPTERQGAGVLAAGAAVAMALQHRHAEFVDFPSTPYVTVRTVTFLLHHHRAQYVELFGSWDSWQRPVVLRADSPGVWIADLPRPAPGIYGYKYRVDEKYWLDDPANPNKAWDGFSGFNSRLTIQGESATPLEV